jgi:hypothetical protein
MVLGTCLIVSVIGVSALMAVRTRQRDVRGNADYLAARFAAQSAIERGLFIIHSDASWRDNRSSGVWFADQALGTSLFSLQGTDPNDDDLSDAESDDLVFIGTGARGDARDHLEVTLSPPIEPLEALSTCLHAGGDIWVNVGSGITAKGAVASGNGNLVSLGTTSGDVEIVGTVFGNITGSVNDSADPKDLPLSDAVLEYSKMATVIPFPGDMQGAVLAPGVNPWGALNVDGLYVVNTGGNDIRLQSLRVEGTLIIQTQGGTARIGPQILMRPAHESYPTLIVDGNAEINLDSSNLLNETWWAINYNPPEAPYDGDSDKDTKDTFPNKIQGLVHVTGSLLVGSESHLGGSLVCEGGVTVNSHLEIVHDQALVDEPPPHYESYGVPVIVPGSWRQVFVAE